MISLLSTKNIHETLDHRHKFTGLFICLKSQRESLVRFYTQCLLHLQCTTFNVCFTQSISASPTVHDIQRLLRTVNICFTQSISASPTVHDIQRLLRTVDICFADSTRHSTSASHSRYLLRRL